VLAAPFLYTMPSELEAFFCFAKFIEECCPLYVQPTLEGVHCGLKVRPPSCPLNDSIYYSDLCCCCSCLTGVCGSWTQTCSRTSGPRSFQLKYGRFHVRPPYIYASASS
jgi:hypothetical protein